MILINIAYFVAGRSGFEPALSRVLVVDSPTYSSNEDERR